MASFWLATALLAGTARSGLAAVGAAATSPDLAVSTGSWQLDARASAADVPTGGPYTAAVGGNLHVLFLSLVNSGTASIVGAAFDLTIVKGGKAQTSVNLVACDGTWNEMAVTCSGPTTLLLTLVAPGGQASVSLPAINPGNSLRLLAQSTQPGTTITFSIAVSSPGQIRPPVELNR